MDPIPGQLQLLRVEPTAVGRPLERIPRYGDVVLTSEQVEQARVEWPTRTPAEQISYMKLRVLNRMKHEIVVDPITGRRAFGGVQDTRKKVKKQLDETIVEAANERVDEINNALYAPISPGNPAMDRHKAAVDIIKISQDMQRLQIAKDDLERASKEEVEDEAAKIVAQLIREGKLSPSDVNLTEADVVELGDG